MSWTFGQVKTRVRNLLDDPDGSYVTDEFIVPLINEVYEDVNSQLTSTQSSFNTEVVELPGIEPGTQNLNAQRIPPGPLSRLSAMPERIDWKPAGTSANAYQLVNNFTVLPDLAPGNGIAGWEFRENVIWLTPANIAVDLRVRGAFQSPALSKDSDVLVSHPRIGYVVAYGAAALVAAVRGNLPWVQVYETKAAEGLDEITGQLVRAEQGQVRRTGRQTGWQSRLGF